MEAPEKLRRLGIAVVDIKQEIESPHAVVNVKQEFESPQIPRLDDSSSSHCSQSSAGASSVKRTRTDRLKTVKNTIETRTSTFRCAGCDNLSVQLEDLRVAHNKYAHTWFNKCLNIEAKQLHETMQVAQADNLQLQAQWQWLNKCLSIKAKQSHEKFNASGKH